MRSENGTTFFSPSDLTAFLACPHLTHASGRGRSRRARQALPRQPARRSDPAQGRRARGRVLATLGPGVVTIPSPGTRAGKRPPRSPKSAMRDGAPYVYQAAFLDGNWRGLADFLERLPDGSLRGARHEARAAREARARAPALLLHRADRADPGLDARGDARVNGLGDTRDVPAGRLPRLLPAAQGAVRGGRRARRRHLPVPGRALRALRLLPALRAAVARRRPPHARRAACRGSRSSGSPRAGSRRSRRSASRRRARRSRRSARRRSRRCATRPSSSSTAADGRAPRRASPARGGSRLRAAPGAEPGRHLARPRGRIRGSRRRAGSSTCSAGSSSTRPASRATSASGRATAPRRRRAFERLIDSIVERRRRFPGMHVYHYAPYERTALTRLMGEYGTREDEVDDLLRGEVLVDLYRVTRQALDRLARELLDQEGRGAVRVRAHGRRVGRQRVGRRVRGVARDAASRRCSTAIRAYNEEDCVSLLELHRWLLEQRPRGAAVARAARGAGARARRRRSTTRSASACATSCSRAPRRASRAGCSRSCSSTTAASRGRSGGSTSTTSRSTTRSCSTTATRSAGSSSTATRCRTSSRSSTRSRSRRRSTRSAGRRSTRRPSARTTCRSTTSAGS